ncbi:expressed unknown protein [Seminavis robusta]|uniref:Uncharacterized protein n=1 Tax=Seminavis robusta TaxID=568900 RepID=A0A9N8H4G4_9STRA|nr:expressed unknown protein [Seminavis robusta]|eukprot:Sro8_g006600.1 n/a (207) ;mRNA; f:75334-76049
MLPETAMMAPPTKSAPRPFLASTTARLAAEAPSEPLGHDDADCARPPTTAPEPTTREPNGRRDEYHARPQPRRFPSSGSSGRAGGGLMGYLRSMSSRRFLVGALADTATIAEDEPLDQPNGFLDEANEIKTALDAPYNGNNVDGNAEKEVENGLDRSNNHRRRRRSSSRGMSSSSRRRNHRRHKQLTGNTMTMNNSSRISDWMLHR